MNASQTRRREGGRHAQWESRETDDLHIPEGRGILLPDHCRGTERYPNTSIHPSRETEMFGGIHEWNVSREGRGSHLTSHTHTHAHTVRLQEIHHPEEHLDEEESRPQFRIHVLVKHLWNTPPGKKDVRGMSGSTLGSQWALARLSCHESFNLLSFPPHD